MTEATRLDVLALGWRGRLLAALIALVAALPGLIALPVTDRDEARFAQASAQMLESGDFVGINFQDAPLNKKPVLIHWLQAASVALVSGPEARRIWAYRIPSLLGAMLAAAAGLAPGARRRAVRRESAEATSSPARSSGASMTLSTGAGLATTDAVFCGVMTLAMAAFGRLYAASRSGTAVGWRTKLLFWLGLGLALLDKGPVALAIAGLAGVMLAIWDRGAPWAKSLGWTWGLLLICAIVGPWAMAITVNTDGGFWSEAIGGDIAAKMATGPRAHGLPPGFHTLLAPLLFFPAAALLPAALVEGWKARADKGVRFAIAWLVPAWLLFEIVPTKLPHDTLPLYGAICWLAAFALTRSLGVWSRWMGVGLSLLAGLSLAIGVVVLASHFGGRGDLWLAIVAGLLALLAAAAGAGVLLSRFGLAALIAAGALGVAAHAVAFAGVLPRLTALWTSDQLAKALDRTHLNPNGGLIPGPVTVVGYAEPSLVFDLGAETEIGDVGDAAEAISEDRPAVVETTSDAAFQAELAADKLKASPAGVVAGYDYSDGKPVRLTIYHSDNPPVQPGPNPP